VAAGSAAEVQVEVGRVREDLVKVQEMLLLFSERLAQLEQGAAAGSANHDHQYDVDENEIQQQQQQQLKGSRGLAKRRRKDKS
jgi:hypothetical protein